MQSNGTSPHHHSTPPLLVKQRLLQDTFNVAEGGDVCEVTKPLHSLTLPSPHSATGMWPAAFPALFSRFQARKHVPALLGDYSTPALIKQMS